MKKILPVMFGLFTTISVAFNCNHSSCNRTTKDIVSKDGTIVENIVTKRQNITNIPHKYISKQQLIRPDSLYRLAKL